MGIKKNPPLKINSKTEISALGTTFCTTAPLAEAIVSFWACKKIQS